MDIHFHEPFPDRDGCSSHLHADVGGVRLRSVGKWQQWGAKLSDKRCDAKADTGGHQKDNQIAECESVESEDGNAEERECNPNATNR